MSVNDGMGTMLKDEDIIVDTVRNNSNLSISTPIMPTFYVKVTHIKTGMTATCGTFRSSWQNKAVAIKMISAGLEE